MKTIVLCLSAIVLFVAGCSKSSTTTTGRDAFVGNYHMRDTVIYVAGGNGQGVLYYDTTVSTYNLQVVAIAGTSDKVLFSNVAGSGNRDTGTVSGSLATFTGSNAALTDATLSGNTITLNETLSGPEVSARGTGTKFQ